MKRLLFILFLATSFFGGQISAHGEGKDFLMQGDSVALIPAGVIRVPDYAFADQKNLKTVVFESPSKCSEIGNYAFLGCGQLQTIVLPESVRSLGEGCFRECTALEEISLPSKIAIIPASCFYGCSGLRKVKLPDKVNDIKRFAFIYCKNLTDINLPEGLTHIGSNAFSRCESLAEVSIPENVIELESYAFSDCFSLKEAKLPSNSNMLGELIFSGCVRLEKLTELSATPPTFDCKSFIFELTDTEAYKRCRLIVALGKDNLYREAHGWNLFETIIAE